MGSETSGNPNPSPSTRFQPGNKEQRRKQKGCRDRISRAFLEAFAADFEENGAATIVRMRKEDPSSYVKIAVALQPKEVEVKHFIEGVEDADIQAVIDELRGVVAARAGAVH